MNPLTERYPDLLADGGDPALIRLVADLDAACAPHAYPQDHITIMRPKREQNTMHGTSVTVPASTFPRTRRAPSRTSWTALAVACAVPLLLGSLLVALVYTPYGTSRTNTPVPSHNGGVVAASTQHPHTWYAIIGTDSPDHAIMVMGYLPGDLYIDVGDTVVWTSRTMNLHSVTFESRGMKPPFMSPGAIIQTGGSRYDGVSFTSSGPMNVRPRSNVDATTPTYRLTFVKPGNFSYVDVAYHSLTGRIHVRPAGTPYPFTQARIDAAVAQQVLAAMATGRAMAARASHESDNHHVTLGIGNGHVSVIRFYPSRILVHVGDTVTFTNRDPINTHTVTSAGSQIYDITLHTDDSPAQYDGHILASGFLGTAKNEDDVYYGTSYKVRFLKAGEFTFFCDLNVDLGMRATIDVVP